MTPWLQWNIVYILQYKGTMKALLQMYLGYFPLINSLNWQIHIISNNTYLMFIWDLFFTHAETLKKKKSSNRYRKIVKRSWRKYVLTRWTKTSDRTDRIIDPFPGMDEKTSCSVLSRKGTGVWNRVFNKRGKIFYP